MFYGREDILDDMMALWGKRVSSLITCRGRRRIGKSTLVAEFARKSSARFIRIEGLKPKRGFTNDDELNNFMTFLSLQTDSVKEACDNWAQAFKALDAQIGDSERTVVLLDEISWMGHYDTHFPDILKIAWDTMAVCQAGSRTTSSTTAPILAGGAAILSWESFRSRIA